MTRYAGPASARPARSRLTGARPARSRPARVLLVAGTGLASALTLIAAVPAPSPAAPSPAAPSPAALAAAPSRPAPGAGLRHAPIRHVIEIMLENHTTANLFPAPPGVGAAQGGAAQAGAASAVRPVPAPPNEGDVQGGVVNSRPAELKAMDRQGRAYRMDGYTAPPFGVQAVTTFGPGFDPNLRYLARSYEFAARNFQPVIGPTGPNVLTALNGTAHGWYSNNPDPHPRPWNSIFDELTAHQRTWKIYYAVPPSVLRGTVWDQLIPAGRQRDLTTADRFLADLAGGRLPAFSFVRPGIGYSEEPREDIGEGDAWLGQLVNAVARSRYWRSTAIFVTYDEGGGFWDPVAPAVASGYGTRTPMVIVSPWARRAVIRRTTTNVSILSFMQNLWGMPALTRLNARQWDLAGAFDFGRRPLPPPRPPVAPVDTIGFHGATDFSEAPAPRAGHRLAVHLEAETGGLTLDRGVSGPATLTWTPPAGRPLPPGIPSSATLSGGRAVVVARFPAPGYYRLKATGPNGCVGWTTIFVRPA